MKVKDLVKLIEKDCWYRVAQKSSHIQFKHCTKKGRVTTPHHEKNEDLAKGTKNSVLKQAGLK